MYFSVDVYFIYQLKVYPTFHPSWNKVEYIESQETSHSGFDQTQTCISKMHMFSVLRLGTISLMVHFNFISLQFLILTFRYSVLHCKTKTWFTSKVSQASIRTNFKVWLFYFCFTWAISTQGYLPWIQRCWETGFFLLPRSNGGTFLHLLLSNFSQTWFALKFWERLQ